MLDDDSLTSYLDVHQTKGVNKEFFRRFNQGKRNGM